MSEKISPNGYSYANEPQPDIPFWGSDCPSLNITGLEVSAGKEDKVITASGDIDGYNPVRIRAVDAGIDNNIIPGNIKKGVDILGVTGTLEAGSASPTLQEKTAEPKTSSVDVIPDEGFDGLSKVTVEPVTSSIDENIVPENIKKDISILGVTGTMEEATEPTLQEKTAEPKTTSQTITPDEGYDGLSQVVVDKVDSSIDANIKSSNIKKGVSILGVRGSLEPKPSSLSMFILNIALTKKAVDSLLIGAEFLIDEPKSSYSFGTSMEVPYYNVYIAAGSADITTGSEKITVYIPEEELKTIDYSMPKMMTICKKLTYSEDAIVNIVIAETISGIEKGVQAYDMLEVI